MFCVNVFTSFVLPALVIAALAALIGFFLSFLGNKLKVEHDERIDEVRSHLSGANCGGCGYAGCDAFAEALVKGEAKLSQCHSTPDEGRENIAAILGVSVEKPTPPSPLSVARAERTAPTNSLTSERMTARLPQAFRAGARRARRAVSGSETAPKPVLTARSRSEKTACRGSITASAARAARVFPPARKELSTVFPLRQRSTSRVPTTARAKRLCPSAKRDV